jgi:hypothetical protein
MKTPDEIKKALRLCDAVCCTLDCPYFRSTSANCVKKLHKNALAYIKRLERHVEPKNRVLTLEELRKFDKGEDFVFVWFEYKERIGRYFSLLQVYLLYADDIYVDLVRPDVSICEHFRGDKYGEEWRCWLRKPTKEEMEATPWA